MLRQSLYVAPLVCSRKVSLLNAVLDLGPQLLQGLDDCPLNHLLRDPVWTRHVDFDRKLSPPASCDMGLNTPWCRSMEYPRRVMNALQFFLVCAYIDVRRLLIGLTAKWAADVVDVAPPVFRSEVDGTSVSCSLAKGLAALAAGAPSPLTVSPDGY